MLSIFGNINEPKCKRKRKRIHFGKNSIDQQKSTGSTFFFFNVTI